MSTHAIQHVWKTSQQRGATLLVLLAIAEHSHPDGTGAYPSVSTIARMARTTERNVSRAIAQLEHDGELIINRGAGPRATHEYTIPMVGTEVMPWADARRRPDKPSVLTGQTPEPPVPSVATSSSRGTGVSTVSAVTPDRASSAKAEAKAQANEAKALWRAERERHRQKSGEAFARFTDQKALRNLVLSLGRALKAGTWADIQTAVKINAAKPESNPWYLDEWTREAAGQRAEAEALQRKMAGRQKEDDELRREFRNKPMRSIGEMLPTAILPLGGRPLRGEADAEHLSNRTGTDA